MAVLPAWLWWLAAPVLATTLAALALWWTGRSRRPPTVRGSIRAHRRFLNALGDAGPADRHGH
jgi:hypothetical protein